MFKCLVPYFTTEPLWGSPVSMRTVHLPIQTTPRFIEPHKVTFDALCFDVTWHHDAYSLSVWYGRNAGSLPGRNQLHTSSLRNEKFSLTSSLITTV